MAKLRLSAAIVGLAMTAAFASPASAIGNKADCNYEGGTTFNMPDGALVCVVQIRPEEYRDNELYDGQQLGVNTCEGEELNDGLFCKIVLVEGKKPELTTPAESTTDTSATMTDKIVEKAKEMAEDEAEKQAKKKARKKLTDIVK